MWASQGLVWHSGAGSWWILQAFAVIFLDVFCACCLGVSLGIPFFSSLFRIFPHIVWLPWGTFSRSPWPERWFLLNCCFLHCCTVLCNWIQLREKQWKKRQNKSMNFFHTLQQRPIFLNFSIQKDGFFQGFRGLHLCCYKANLGAESENKERWKNTLRFPLLHTYTLSDSQGVLLLCPIAGKGGLSQSFSFEKASLLHSSLTWPILKSIPEDTRGKKKTKSVNSPLPY